MARFFVEANQINGDAIIITDADAKHIGQVLRLDINDDITVCDGVGNDYLCKIKDIKKKEVLCEIVSKTKAKTEPQVELTLFQCIPKKDKMEWIIQKSVELGINEIVPVMSSRTIVKFENDKKKQSKIDRWQKISESAAKQSRRGIIPKIQAIHSYGEILKQTEDFDLCILAYENEETVNLQEVLRHKQGIKKIAILIGPEGGFEEQEVDEAMKYGYKVISLGQRILRAETASIMLTGLIMYEMDEM